MESNMLLFLLLYPLFKLSQTPRTSILFKRPCLDIESVEPIRRDHKVDYVDTSYST